MTEGSKNEEKSKKNVERKNEARYYSKMKEGGSKHS